MKEFNEWMARIGNIYYANNELMEKAFDKIHQGKLIQALQRLGIPQKMIKVLQTFYDNPR